MFAELFIPEVDPLRMLRLQGSGRTVDGSYDPHNPQIGVKGYIIEVVIMTERELKATVLWNLIVMYSIRRRFLTIWLQPRKCLNA